jgi:hypothetical protein
MEIFATNSGGFRCRLMLARRFPRTILTSPKNSHNVSISDDGGGRRQGWFQLNIDNTHDGNYVGIHREDYAKAFDLRKFEVG